MVRFFCDRCGEEIDKISPYASPFSDVEDHIANTYYVETLSFAEPRISKDERRTVYTANGNVLLCESCRGRIDRMIDKFMKDGKDS